MKRSILRWIHLALTIPILGYIYGEPSEVQQYAGAVRLVFVPVIILSGFWMYAGVVFAVLGVAVWLGAIYLSGVGAAILSQVVLFIAWKIWVVIRARRSKSSTRMKTIFSTFALVLPLFCVSSVYAGDGFESVRCGSDIPKAMIGRKVANETVVAIEARHKDLQLKDLGAEIISDDERLNLIFWMICGDEYAVLQYDDVIKDVVKFPKHSKDTPQFDGLCQLNGKDLPDVVLGVLKKEEGAAKLPAVKAWRIDQKQKKFVEPPTEGLRCGPDGISTEDSGQCTLLQLQRFSEPSAFSIDGRATLLA